MNNIKNSIKINNFKELDDSYSLCSLDNIFLVFNSIKALFYFIDYYFKIFCLFIKCVKLKMHITKL